MERPKIVVATGTLPADAFEAANRAGHAELVYRPLSDVETIRESSADADAVMVTINPLPAAAIAALGSGVRIIGRAGIGLDTIDLEAARQRGIAVFHTPDYCAPEVALHTTALILALYRRLKASDRVAREDWPHWRTIGIIRAFDELTVGIVGGGRIGREVARLLLPMGPKVLVYDPYLESPPPGADLAPTLDALLAASDILTLHSPLTEETKGLIGRSALTMMRPGALLVNVSRGGLLDEDAVADALESGHLGGAAFDVLTSEPPVPTMRLLAAPNTLLSPHTAWYSTASEKRVWEDAVGGVISYLEGRTPSRGRMAVTP